MSEIEFVKRIVLKQYPGKVLLLIVNEILASFLVVIGIGGIITVLAALLNGDSQLPGLLGNFFDYLGLEETDETSIIGFLVAILLLQGLLEGFSKYLASSIAINLTTEIRSKMNEALRAANWIDFSKLDQGKYMQTLVVESSMAGWSINHLGAMLASGIMVVALLLWMLFLSYEAFLVFSLVGGALLLILQTVLKRTRNVSKQSIEILKEMSNVARDTRRMFKMLMAENLISLRIKQMKRLIEKAAFLDLRKTLYSILNTQVTKIETAVVILILSFYYLVFSTGDSSNLIVNLLLLQRVATYFGVFQNKRQLMTQHIPSYETCLEMMEIFKEDPRKTDRNLLIDSIQEKIEARDVSYTYPGVNKGIQEVSAVLPPKGLVFLVGKSGSGKTTFVDILLGLISPASGSILIDDQDLSDLDPRVMSEMVVYVSQEAYLFEGTIRENLTLGQNSVPAKELMKALEDANCSDLVNSLPRGLETPVLSGGLNFSGGERQRLSLARALVKRGKIVVLDEPSAGIDAESEGVIFRAIERLSKKILIIVITHSQKAIQNQENIIYFERGFCVWNGSYEQLIQNEDLPNFLKEKD